MNHVSIFEKKWLDLVFEGKNKAYGAYQLRRENPKTTMLALLLGLLLLTSLASIGLLASRLGKTAPTVTDIFDDGPITVTEVIVTPPPPQPKTDVMPPVVDNKEPDDATQLDDFEVVPEHEATETKLTNEPTKNPDTESGNGISGENPTTGAAASSGAGTSGTEIIPAPSPGTILVPGVLDKMPEYPGGIKKFYEYVGNHFDKPEIDNVETVTVIVMFVIEKDGSMTDIRVARDPGYGMAKEAIRTLKSMKTKWTAGIKNGQPVRTAYTLPITVKIN